MLRFEQVKARRLLSVTPMFDNGLLTFTGDSTNDTIAVAANASGNVTLNGNEILGGIAAASVTGILVEAGGGSDTINLVGVLPEKFTALTDLAIEVYGEAGGDTITGSPLGDFLDGGPGVDWLQGGNGDDLLLGGADNDVLQGGSGADVLKGEGGTDTVQGNDGDDQLWVGAGSDTLWGGAGNDEFLFDPATGDLNTDTIRDDAGAGTDTFDFSLFAGAATADVVVHLEGDDTLTGNALNNVLVGGPGDDELDSGDGNDFLSGDEGNDSLVGGPGDDVYWFNPTFGALGSDTITEAANADSDTLDFRNFTTNLDVHLGATGSQLQGTLLTITLSNNTAIENVVGGSGNDSLYGNDRNNMMDGRGGTDLVWGNGGDDVLYGGMDNDFLWGHSGKDSLFGGQGDDLLVGGIGDDFLFGEAGDDILADEYIVYTGEGGNDYMDGGPGDDVLKGYSGNDVLIGGPGDDELVGGGGSDTYVYRWVIGDDGLGHDTIFEAGSGSGDTLDFTEFYADDYVAPNPATVGAQTVSEIQASNPIDLDAEPVVEDLLTLTFNQTSTVENIDDPGTFVSALDSIVADSYTTPGFLRLLPLGTYGSLDTVTFYLDSNNNGVWDASDQWLGEDTDRNDGWFIELEYDASEGGYLVDDGMTVQTVVLNAVQNAVIGVASLSGIDGGVSRASGIGIGPGTPVPGSLPRLVRHANDADLELGYWTMADAYLWFEGDDGEEWEDDLSHRFYVQVPFGKTETNAEAVIIATGEEALGTGSIFGWGRVSGSGHHVGVTGEITSPDNQAQLLGSFGLAHGIGKATLDSIDEQGQWAPHIWDVGRLLGFVSKPLFHDNVNWFISSRI